MDKDLEYKFILDLFNRKYYKGMDKYLDRHLHENDKAYDAFLRYDTEIAMLYNTIHSVALMKFMALYKYNRRVCKILIESEIWNTMLRTKSFKRTITSYINHNFRSYRSAIDKRSQFLNNGLDFYHECLNTQNSNDGKLGLNQLFLETYLAAEILGFTEYNKATLKILKNFEMMYMTDYSAKYATHASPAIISSDKLFKITEHMHSDQELCKLSDLKKTLKKMINTFGPTQSIDVEDITENFLTGLLNEHQVFISTVGLDLISNTNFGLSEKWISTLLLYIIYALNAKNLVLSEQTLKTSKENVKQAHDNIKNNKELKQLHRDYKHELSSAKNEIKTLKRQHTKADNANKDIERLGADCRNLQKDNSYLKSQLSALTEENTQLQTMVKDLNAKLDFLEIINKETIELEGITEVCMENLSANTDTNKIAELQLQLATRKVGIIILDETIKKALSKDYPNLLIIDNERQIYKLQNYEVIVYVWTRSTHAILRKVVADGLKDRLIYTRESKSDIENTLYNYLIENTL